MQGSTESSQQGDDRTLFQSFGSETFTKKISEPLSLGLPVKGVGPHTHSALAPTAQRTGSSNREVPTVQL